MGETDRRTHEQSMINQVTTSEDDLDIEDDSDSSLAGILVGSRIAALIISMKDIQHHSKDGGGRATEYASEVLKVKKMSVILIGCNDREKATIRWLK